MSQNIIRRILLLAIVAVVALAACTPEMWPAPPPPPSNADEQEPDEVYSAPARATPTRCTSDYSCPYGSRCVKEPYRMDGSCARAVNEYGNPTFEGPRGDSLGAGQQQCWSVAQCPPGFRCQRGNCLK